MRNCDISTTTKYRQNLFCYNIIAQSALMNKLIIANIAVRLINTFRIIISIIINNKKKS